MESLHHLFLLTSAHGPQGDALSPILFAIYLEAANKPAIRALYAKGLVRPDVDALDGLPDFLVYADDTDFVILSREYFDRLLEMSGPIFKDDFELMVNVDKTQGLTQRRGC